MDSRTRPRAPTITVDTSNVSEHLHEEPQSASIAGNPNSLLAVPARARGDSVDSKSSSQFSATSNSTAVGPDSPLDGIHPDPGGDGGGGGGRDEAPPENEVFEPEGDQERQLFHTEGTTPFGVTPGHLSRLVARKNLWALYYIRGLPGLCKALRTNVKTGLPTDETELRGQVKWEDVKAVEGYSTQPDDVEDPLEPKTPPARTTTNMSKVTVSQSAYGDRTRIFGRNVLPEPKAKSILQLAWISLHDKILIVLVIACAVSLALGIYQTVKPPPGEKGAKIQWVEGVAIFVAISVVVLVGAGNDWNKERQFMKLNRKKDDRIVLVRRSGKIIKISVFDVYVGDVMVIEQGDVVPVDGIFIDGHNLSCDESSATGESELMRKTAGDTVLKMLDEGQTHNGSKRLDPFILSGSKVSEGVGSFLVTAVGENSESGKTMASLREGNDVTPLQYKLNRLAGQIAKLGSLAGLLMFIVLFIEFLATLNKPVNGAQRTVNEKVSDVIQDLILAVSIIVVAVPEGLPLAVTLALAFATRRMTKDNNLVRHLKSCETMGNATVICSDKTGTLTQNAMTVVAGSFGRGSLRAGQKSKTTEQQETTHEVGTESPNATTASNAKSTVMSGSGVLENATTITMPEISGQLAGDMRLMLKDSIAMNSTAFENEENGRFVFSGSKTETALLSFARECLGLARLETERDDSRIAQLYPFDSRKKCMGVVVKLAESGAHRLYVKGAPEIVLSKCNWVLRDPQTSLDKDSIADDDRRNIRRIISSYASMSLRTIGLAYKDFEAWPPEKGQTADRVEFDQVFGNLVWAAIVGIQDPVRNGVPEAVKTCERAGVKVVMVTGDNVETARAIAKECGILKPDGIVLEGPQFRMLSDADLEEILPTLCVIARSSPEDKKTLVKAFKARGEVVAVTGDGTNDAPALKAADVGFSMGIAGTEVAKEASDIILMDDNFSSIVKALAWGRTINDAVKKFLQFQITVNITAVILTFVSAVASTFIPANQGAQSSVINAVQLLWVNLIMDTFAALALATDQPSYSLLDRKPEARTASLITTTMWKMIWVQAIAQMFVAFFIYFYGQNLPYIKGLDVEHRDTLIFNIFVWMQIFNCINCRRIDNRKNIFEGISKNWMFFGIVAIMAAGQVLIVFVGGQAFAVQRLDGTGWAISIIIGLASIPLGYLTRLIPDPFMAKIFGVFPSMPSFRILKAKKGPAKDVENTGKMAFPTVDWSHEIAEKLADDLKFYRQLRGRRLALLRQGLRHPRETVVFATQHGSGSRSRSGSRHSVLSAIVAPGAMAMASSIGRGSIGGASRAGTGDGHDG